MPLRIQVIADSPLFSEAGKGTCYLVHFGDRCVMIDTGVHAFTRLGPEGLEKLYTIIATHSHHDHCRWFSEYLLYFRYMAPSAPRRLRLAAVEEVLEGFRRSDAAAPD